MTKLFFKRRYLLILLILIPVFLYFMYNYGIKNREPEGTTRIFEIKNTQLVYYSPDSKIATIEKHYMIIKPPEDLHELKILVEKFTDENPVNMKMFEDTVKNESKITSNEIIRKDVYIRFYRESSRLPRDWQPNEAYMNTDRMEHHGNDCIASVAWSDLGQHKTYSVMKKSKKNNDLVPIERIEYIDDKVVNHTYGKK